jgi:hypothetical protein
LKISKIKIAQWRLKTIQKSRAKPKSHTSRKTKNQFNMKNFTKIMTVVGVIAIASLLLAFVPTSPNEGNEKILTVRVVECQTAAVGSFITIVDESGKQEVVDLDRLGLKKNPYVSNMVKINNTLNSITDKGYKLVFTAGGGDQFIIYTTYTFVKK